MIMASSVEDSGMSRFLLQLCAGSPLDTVSPQIRANTLFHVLRKGDKEPAGQFAPSCPSFPPDALTHPDFFSSLAKKSARKSPVVNGLDSIHDRCWPKTYEKRSPISWSFLPPLMCYYFMTYCLHHGIPLVLRRYGAGGIGPLSLQSPERDDDRQVSRPS